MSDPDSLSSYDFELPPERIAQEPAAERTASRLLVLPRRVGDFVHARFTDLPGLLRRGDLIVFNDTRVIPARIELRRATGGKVRGLLLGAPRGPVATMLLEGKGRLAEGDVLTTPAGATVTLKQHAGGGRWDASLSADAAADLLATGRMPLPPYIRRDVAADPRDTLDHERYQTVFAREDGAVAAPTAGLHFDSAMLDAIGRAGVATARVTLHVGLGTFLPVRTDDLREHVMHAEHVRVPAATTQAVREARSRSGRVIAVGTTVVRALESWSLRGEPDEFEGATDLFIRPGFEFRVAGAMLTNFHLPKSTLLVLVAAFAGRERVLDAYAAAVAEKYRFFSYGDAMWIA